MYGRETGRKPGRKPGSRAKKKRSESQGVRDNLLGRDLRKQPFREFMFWGTHLFKSGAGSLLKVPPNKDSKTLVLV